MNELKIEEIARKHGLNEQEEAILRLAIILNE
jgi:hypothetical protein